MGVVFKMLPKDIISIFLPSKTYDIFTYYFKYYFLYFFACENNIKKRVEESLPHQVVNAGIEIIHVCNGLVGQCVEKLRWY